MTPHHTALRRRHAGLLRGLIITVTALVALLAVPGRASAHPTLLFTTPAAETAEATAPTSVALVFGEPVTLGEHALVVQDAAGRPVGVDQVATAREGRAVTGHLTQTLPSGVYTVRWRVTGVDGDLVEGQFRFAVGAPITSAAAGGPGSGLSWPATLLRWLLFAGLAVAAGGLAGRVIVTRGRQVNPSLAEPRSWVGAGAAIGLAGAIGLLIVLAADAGSLAVALGSTPGRVAAVEAAGFAAAAGAAATRRAGWAALPLAAVAVADAVRSHLNVTRPGWGAALTAVHLAAAAVWVGALLHVVRTAAGWRSQRSAVWWLVRAYARLAAWVFATVVVTGTVAALLLVPLPALTATGYGRLLLAKLALVAAAAGLALAARRRLRRGPTADRPVTGLTRLEAGALVGVLAVTAALVSSPPPGGQQTQPAAPPPPAGVVLPLGTLAGQIGVGVAASERQLVVRLSAPSRGDYYATPGKQTFTLAGRLTAAGHRPTDLHWRGCGQGCFYTPASWRRGDNLLTLHASAPGWRGGTTSLVIPWPVQAASDQIGRVVAALRATDRFTLYEAVSSDTTSGPPDPQPLPMSGPFFLASEPYGSGVAPQAVVLPPPAAGQTRLALGFPADGRYVDLVIDDASARILDETVVDAKHLTRRHFVYHHDES